MKTAVLLIQCPDQRGIVAKISDFVFGWDGNITDSAQHSTDPDGGRFFMRVEFNFDPSRTKPEEVEKGLAALAGDLKADYELHYESDVMNMAVAVSKYDHCLVDLLYRVRAGELKVNIPFVVSNHDTLREIVEREGIPFHHLPVSPETKADQERQFLELLGPGADFLVLARYMQIMSDNFLTTFGKDTINIHHSFLPSFKGANPYRQAYDRGVKIIGATAHFATASLDEGPIIEQAVERVSHRDNVEILKQKGRIMEQQALAGAIRAYAEHRVLRYEHKTIVFE